MGLIGSNEWVEEYLKVLQARAVAVLNVDTAISGNISLGVQAVPLLYRTLFNAAKVVPNPNTEQLKQGLRTVYSSWAAFSNISGVPRLQDSPYVPTPGSSSDHHRFLSYVGVPVADMGYYDFPRTTYPLYHTMYEIPWLAEHLVDRHFLTSTAVGQFLLETARSLSDSLVIPFDVPDYASMMMLFLDELDVSLKQVGLMEVLKDYDDIMESLMESGRKFVETSRNFQVRK